MINYIEKNDPSKNAQQTSPNAEAKKKRKNKKKKGKAPGGEEAHPDNDEPANVE